MNNFREIFIQIAIKYKLAHLVSFIQKKVFRLGSVGLCTIISPSVKFKGSTKQIFIGANCRLESGAIFECEGINAKIILGDNSIIHSGSALITGKSGTINVGKYFSLNHYSILYGHGGLIIGDYVRVATHVVIIPANHIFADPETPITFQGLDKAGINIENDVWLGAGVRVLDGVHIGRGSVVGAGSVVTKSLGEFSISVGVPAKQIGSRISY